MTPCLMVKVNTVPSSLTSVFSARSGTAAVVPSGCSWSTYRPWKIWCSTLAPSDSCVLSGSMLMGSEPSGKL